MANTDPASRVTDLYNRLSAIDSMASRMVLLSEINSIQVALMGGINTNSSDIVSMKSEIQTMQSQISKLITDLRSAT